MIVDLTNDEDRQMAQLVTLCKALGVSRDYRKECWIAVYAARPINSKTLADEALAAFDKQFPNPY